VTPCHKRWKRSASAAGHWADLFAEATACQVHTNSRPTLVMLQDYHLLLKPVISTVIASPPIGRRNKKSALAALSTW
jgi:hypothetical protein